MNLQAWCNLSTVYFSSSYLDILTGECRRAEAFGGNGCCGSRDQSGCCNSCCDDAFNKDSFDNPLAPTDSKKPIDSQPAPAKDMTTLTSSDNAIQESWPWSPKSWVYQGSFYDSDVNAYVMLLTCSATRSFHIRTYLSAAETSGCWISESLTRATFIGTNPNRVFPSG